MEMSRRRGKRRRENEVIRTECPEAVKIEVKTQKIGTSINIDVVVQPMKSKR